MPYSDIYPYITERLQDSVAGVANSAFDLTITDILRRMLSPHGLTYATVSADDIAWVNEAAGKRSASRLLTSYSTGGANSDLTGERTGQSGITRQFATPVNGGLKAEWLREAADALAQTSFYKAATPAATFIGKGHPPRRCCR